MRDIFISISILILIVSFLSFSMTYIKAKLDEDFILIKKAANYIIPFFISFITLNVSVNDNIIYIALLLLNVSVYICTILYNIKWNHYELKKEMAEDLLRDCTNFTEEDFIRFTKEMSRTDQINWLKSLTWIDEETFEELHEDGTKTTITTEKIVPLIEEDDDLEDFECLLKEYNDSINF